MFYSIFIYIHIHMYVHVYVFASEAGFLPCICTHQLGNFANTSKLRNMLGKHEMPEAPKFMGVPGSHSNAIAIMLTFSGTADQMESKPERR